MPTINKPDKKKKDFERKDTDMRKLRREAYNNSTWRKLRDTYMHQHPLCQDCLGKGKVTPAEDIHHDKSPFKNGEINYSLLLDYDNLVALCKDCHGTRHAKEQGHVSPEDVLKQLDELFDENKPDSYFE